MKVISTALLAVAAVCTVTIPARSDIKVSLDTLCSQFPLNSRCTRVDRGLPAVETGELIPEGCTALPAIGAESTEVTKTASPGRVPNLALIWFGPNWNTDFVVPEEAVYSRYYASVLSQDIGNYDIEMYLKYQDGTADLVHEEDKFPMSEQHLHVFSGEPRSGTQPYEVNLKIGGPGTVQDTYTIQVLGCP
ncbi:MAG: hypothetical protein AB4040_17075 [Synechococcus sp.]